jgi:hypothetical protein
MTGIDRSQLFPLTVWIRVTRTTLEYGPNEKVFHHPYPLHVNNDNALPMGDSWFIPVTDAMLCEQRIKYSSEGAARSTISRLSFRIEKLFMLRLKQGPLSSIRQLCDFTAETLQVQGTSLCNILS